jgi:TolA-binding protein
MLIKIKYKRFQNNNFKLKIISFIVITLFLVMIPFNVLFSDEEEASSLYERGMDFEDRGEYSRAIKFFGRLIRKYPDSKWSDDALFFIGECFGKLGEFKKAIKAYKRVVIQSDSQDLCADALYMIGESYIKLKDNSNAVMVFKALKKNYPDSIWATDIDRQIEKYSIDSIKLLQDKEINVSENDVEILKKENFDSTNNTDNSNMDSVLYEVALNFHEKGLYDRALEIYERIIKNFKNSVWYEDVLYMSGEARVAIGDYEKALKCYELVLKGRKSSFYADAQFMVAECYLTLKNYSEAINNYQILLDIYPLSEWRVDARYMIGECNIALGNFKKAADVFKELIREFPQSDWTINIKY